MAKKRFTVDQRGRIAEKVMEWGNLVFIAWVIGQVISGGPFRPSLAIAGTACLFGAYWVGQWLMKGGGKLWR